MGQQEKTSTNRRPLRIGYAHVPTGVHPAAWRTSAREPDPLDPDVLTDHVRIADHARLDFILFSPRVTRSRTAWPDDPATFGRPEGFTAASYLATITSHIGFIVSGNTSYAEPYNLARLTASLDHVTSGRAGWLVTTGATDRPRALELGRELTPEEHYARASEAVGVVRKLWDSWEDEAFILDKKSGRYVDGDRIHATDHQGEYFRVRGPLNVARPPQGQIVIAHHARSDLSIDLAAQEADLVFIDNDSPEGYAPVASRIRERACIFGREADALSIVADIVPIVAPTREEARGIYDALNVLLLNELSNDRQTAYRVLDELSQHVGIELLPLGLDEPLDPKRLSDLNENGRALLDIVRERTGRGVADERLPRLSDLLFAYVIKGNYLIDDPEGVADRIEVLVREGNLDGVVIKPAVLPDQLKAFVSQVLPVLTHRGLFEPQTQGTLLREYFGRSKPQNRNTTSVSPLHDRFGHTG